MRSHGKANIFEDKLGGVLEGGNDYRLGRNMLIINGKCQQGVGRWKLSGPDNLGRDIKVF
ncbi:MAG TPA: hypothetical protein DHU63_05715 [Candidatus Marinimicrobia bacterium]|nr:hypothetical protein [Candidatus Neomarinimicrobiota bacterium]